MSICTPLKKRQRQASDYPQLAPGGAALRLPSWDKMLDRAQIGRMAGGGCLYGGQINAFWAPLRDLLHITNGPVGCGVYVHADRAVSGGAVGVGQAVGCDDLHRPKLPADHIVRLRLHNLVIQRILFVAAVGDVNAARF